jgi:hypothetical protein
MTTTAPAGIFSGPKAGGTSRFTTAARLLKKGSVSTTWVSQWIAKVACPTWVRENDDDGPDRYSPELAAVGVGRSSFASSGTLFSVRNQRQGLRRSERSQGL